MNYLRDVPFCAPFGCNFTTANVSPRHLSKPEFLRAHIAPPCRWRAFLVALVSCCLPFALSGCAGGLIVAAANSGSLQATPNTVTFGEVPLGQSASATVSLVNQRSAAVQVSQVNVTGQSFSASGGSDLPITVAAGGTYNFYVNFSPAAKGVAAGQVTIISNSPADGTISIGLNGTGTSAGATNTTNLGVLSCASGSITGAGTDSCTVALSAAAPSGGFSVRLASNNSSVSVPASVTVAAGTNNATFTATVSPVSSAQTATLTASAGSVAESFALQLGTVTATLTPTLGVNTTTVAFGSVALNSPATQSLILSSTGTASVTVSAATVTGTGFTVSGASLPLTLSPNQTATLSIEFDPTAAGAASGSLTLTSNSSTGSSTVIALTGTGETASASSQVSLTWDAPTTSTDPVAGYYVYRSPSGSSSYQQLNASAITQTSYDDTTAQAGQTYEYIVESVDASGVTSAPSNMAGVLIP